MLNSRKLYHALATVGLLALGSVSSFAQTCSGTMTTTNLGVRPEGLAELSGDINVTCGAGNNLPDSFTVLVQLTSGVAVTNTATTGTGAPTITVTGSTPTTTVSYPSIANTVSFQVNGAGTGSTAFRISGVRINANAAAAAGITSVNATLIITTVTGSGTTVLPLSNNPSLVATILSKSVNFSIFYATAQGIAQGSSSSATYPSTTPSTNAGAQTFPTCVTARTVAGFFRFTENFTNVIRSVGNEGPGASQGTQLRIQLTGIPAGVGVWVPSGVFTTGNNILSVASGTTSITTQPTAAQRSYLVSTATAPGTTTPIEVEYTGNYAAVDSTGVLVFNVNTSSSTVPSETTLDTINIPFILNFTAGPTVGIGSATAKGTLAPVSTSSSTIPRFADSGDTATAFSTAVCATTLLYPYVTTAGGFDTGIAIANTSADVAPLTTAPQSGTCVLTAFGAYESGATVPAAGTTPTINAGRVYAISLTDSTAFASGARLGAGFSGYLIAQCNFQLAHGYAFISDYGARNLAQGYLALVLDVNSGTRTPNSSAAIERLSN